MRMKEITFGPGRLENITLKIARCADGYYRTIATGQYAIFCGTGNMHTVSIDQRESDDEQLYTEAYEGNITAASDITENMIDEAMKHWFDPCEDYKDEDHD